MSFFNRIPTKVSLAFSIHPITGFPLMLYVSCGVVATASTFFGFTLYRNPRAPRATVLVLLLVSILSAISPLHAYQHRRPSYFLPFIVVQWSIAALIVIWEMIVIETLIVHARQYVSWKMVFLNVGMMLVFFSIYFLSVFPILRARNEVKKELRNGGKEQSPTTYFDNPNQEIDVLDVESSEQNAKSGNGQVGSQIGVEEVIEL